MKGLVFQEFLNHIERRYGVDMVDSVIDAAALPHDAHYTSGGTYPFQEMVALVSALCRMASQPMPSVLDAFGRHCFARWVHYAPHFFRDRPLFDILQNIDTFHETEVRKLYPDAELPSFVMEDRNDRAMTIGYYSCKPLADLACGVIHGAAAHLGDSVRIRCEPAELQGRSYTRLRVELDQRAVAA